MARNITVFVTIGAPIDTVWADLADLASHVEWMADAESITFVTPQTSGVGTTMEVETRVGPLRLNDIMEFTGWDPPHRMAIRHQGLVTGVGEFVLTDIGGDTTRFMWTEALTFPWYLGGPITEFFAAPVLSAIWKRNLARLAARF
jgi:carbon monoxide dehydrogenase subunit G